MSAFGNEDIGGLDVSMNYFFRVGCIKRIRNLNGHREQCLGIHGLVADAMLQRETVQEFHRDEGMPVLFADVIDRADIWVI